MCACARSAGRAPRCRRRRTGTARRARRARRRARSSCPAPSQVAPSGNGAPFQISRIRRLHGTRRPATGCTRPGLGSGPDRGQDWAAAGLLRGSGGARPPHGSGGPSSQQRARQRRQPDSPGSQRHRDRCSAAALYVQLKSSEARGPKLQIISCSPRRNRSQRPSSSKSIASTSPVSVLRRRISSAYRSSSVDVSPAGQLGRLEGGRILRVGHLLAEGRKGFELAAAALARGPRDARRRCDR